MNYVSRYAPNGDTIFEQRGDADGWTIFDESGRGIHRYPQLYLVTRDGFWAAQETGSGLRLHRRDGTPPVWGEFLLDIRNLGVSPSSGSLNATNGLEQLWGPTNRPVKRWTEEVHGELIIVTAEYEGGARSTWHLNPARGFNAERAAFETASGATWEVVNVLRQFGATWFPEESTFYENGRLVESIVVKSAEFDPLHGNNRFTPADIDAQPGMLIAVQNGPRTSVADRPIWNGEEVSTSAQFDKDERAGKRAKSPRLLGGYRSPYTTPEQAEQRKLVQRQMEVRYALTRHAGLWDRYVREFIQRYKLDPEQTNRAWAITLQCRDQASQVIDRRRSELTALISEREALPKDTANQEKHKDMQTRIDSLLAPIQEIFAERLKPGLERLPTRTQRREAELQPTQTAPAP